MTDLKVGPSRAADEVQPPSNVLTGPASPRRPVCAPGAVPCSLGRRPQRLRRVTMSATSWIRGWTNRLTRPGTRPPTHRRRVGLRPRLEVLEDRSVPAALGSALGIGTDSGQSQARGVAVDAAGNTYLT